MWMSAQCIPLNFNLLIIFVSILEIRTPRSVSRCDELSVVVFFFFFLFFFHSSLHGVIHTKFSHHRLISAERLWNLRRTVPSRTEVIGLDYPDHSTNLKCWSRGELCSFYRTLRSTLCHLSYRDVQPTRLTEKRKKKNKKTTVVPWPGWPSFIEHAIRTTPTAFFLHSVLHPWCSGFVRSTSAVDGGEWLWVQAPSMVVGTQCRGPWLAPGYWLMHVKQIG